MYLIKYYTYTRIPIAYNLQQDRWIKLDTKVPPSSDIGVAINFWDVWTSVSPANNIIQVLTLRNRT